MNSSKKLKFGAIMSYSTLTFNMISGLLYTPWMIEQIGQSNYGLYTTATSLITLFVMDFGMSAAVTRFVSKYNAEGNQQKVNDFLGVVYKLYLLIDAVILIALVVVGLSIDKIYADNLSANELETFKVLFVIVGIFSVISFPFTNLNGILTAYESFTGLKSADLFHKVFIVVAMVIALLMGKGVYALVIVNAVAGLLTIAIKLVLIKNNTDVKVNFKHKDKGMFKEIFGFSIWTTISGIAQRLIFNITPSIIMAVSTTAEIGSSIFGLAATIEGYVFMFANAINGMFMPRISKLVYEKKKDTVLVDLMIKVGRIQCFIVGILLVGFISFGKSFIVDIWNKSNFTESYFCAVLLIIPSFFFLPLQIANTTIVVENKVKLQSIVYVIMGVLNASISMFASKYWGAIGASFSIFIAYMVRNVLMLIIHIKVLHLDMKHFFKESYFKITPYLILMLGVGLFLEYFNPMVHGSLRFLVNGCAFVGIFAVTSFLFVFNKYEKNLCLGTFKKVLRKIKK